jgi:hypothetical protein
MMDVGSNKSNDGLALRIEVMLFVFIDELHAVNMLLAFLLSI